MITWQKCKKKNTDDYNNENYTGCSIESADFNQDSLYNTLDIILLIFHILDPNDDGRNSTANSANLLINDFPGSSSIKFISDDYISGFQFDISLDTEYNELFKKKCLLHVKVLYSNLHLFGMVFGHVTKNNCLLR